MAVFFRTGEAGAQCSAGAQISASCGSISFEGCCNAASTVQWCENNVLCEIDCSANLSPDDVCGWKSDYGFYDCGGSGYDPSGLNPCSCSGAMTCPGGSCAGNCDSGAGTCYCDETCWNFGDCCPDVCQQCGYCNGSCVPQCSGKECGDDGCGGSCGTCPWGWTCNSGKCSCTPSCSGKECGSDGCGSVCAWCPTGYVCNYLNKCEKQACQPDCFAKQCGDDGCSGSCGTCPSGYVCDVWGQCKITTCTAP
ncbi:MAG: hypothetical protein FJ088_13620, partial [Deltaproteobacteria bacterium]|nr:hypothetical protein [Deltaproteobacteria bacterium]